MKLISWNVNGIRANYKKGFIDFIKKEKPDIFCCQEIKAEVDQFPEEIFNIKGYRFFINPAQRKGYSGTMVMTKKEPILDSFSLGFKKFDQEGRVIRLDFDNFVFMNFYIPQGGRKKENLDYKLESYKKLFSYLEKIKNKNIILTGDFNIAHKEIDLARPKENKNNIMFTEEERSMLDKLLSLGFVDSFRHFNKNGGNYSWWPYFANARERDLGWRIDYFFTSKNFVKDIKKAYILKKVQGSDHAPVVLEIN
jgi:exodeoxyribonuclease-3